jgi:hypothetical protein
MIRRAIAIVALSTWAASGAAAQTAPVVDAQTGTVTISPQTLDWFRQRLAEEEERLRQLQVTVQQIARGLPRLTETRTFVPKQGPAEPNPTPATPVADASPAAGQPLDANPAPGQPLPAPGQPLPATTEGAPSLSEFPNRPSLVPGRDGRRNAATSGTGRPARIYIPSLDPRMGGVVGDGGTALPPDTSGSPVGVDAIPGGPGPAPEGGLGGPMAPPPDPGDQRSSVDPSVPAGEVATVTTEPSVVTLAPTPDPSRPAPRLSTPAVERVARRSVATDPGKRETERRIAKGTHPTSRTSAVLANRETIGQKLATGTKRSAPTVRRKKSWRHTRRYHAGKKAHGKRYSRNYGRSHRWARHSRPGREITLSTHRTGRRDTRRASARTRTQLARVRTHRNCELCRIARAHLRSPHAVIRSRVAGWRKWSNRQVRAPGSVRHRRAGAPRGASPAGGASKSTTSKTRTLSSEP